MKTHKLKILPEYFHATAAGNKSFEIRLNDRDFQRGDKLILQEFDGTNYTAKEIHAYVSYILTGGVLGIEKNYCILSLKITEIIKPKQ
ncbi:MAG: DUF3850 domain-containing protein [Bacteroidetes bacterium]|nr:DUF3850 domain-containing protein [Bacteroidota bacterium]